MKRKQIGVINLSADIPTIDFYNKAAFRDDLRAFKDGDKVYVEVINFYRRRTLKQNSLFHSYCGIISEDTGQDIETVKSTIKLLYARKPVLDEAGNELLNTETGEVLEYVQETSKMNTVEMMTLCDNTRMFALDFFNIVLPLPDEQIEIKI